MSKGMSSGIKYLLVGAASAVAGYLFGRTGDTSVSGLGALSHNNPSKLYLWRQISDGKVHQWENGMKNWSPIHYWNLPTGVPTSPIPQDLTILARGNKSHNVYAFSMDDDNEAVYVLQRKTGSLWVFVKA
jgi:hypothetical protein